MVDPVHPDRIAHLVVTNEGASIRLFLQNGTANIPTEPYENSTPHTTEIPLKYIDAVVDRAWVDDGGLLVDAFLRLSQDEWQRSGLSKHTDKLARDLDPSERQLY